MDTQKINEALAAIEASDATLADELRQRMQSAFAEVEFVPKGLESNSGLKPETIVLRTGRPVLAIKQNAVSIEIQDADSEVWRRRLIDAGPRLAVPIRGVGRIEVQGHPSYTWLGTGWLVRPDILVTNRHVADLFTRRSGQGFSFRVGIGQQPMAANVDFLEEIGSTRSSPFTLSKVLWVEDENGLDLAFFRVTGAGLAQPIPLSERGAQTDDQIAAVGYPARDSRIPEQDLMDKLFGNVYDKKRLAPGQVMRPQEGMLRHNCSTLGGNSGSVLVSLKTGEAVGIHFAGRFLEANYGVPSDRLAERLHEVERAGVGHPAAQPAVIAVPKVEAAADGTLSLTVPVHITVRLGDLLAAAGVAAKPVHSPAVIAAGRVDAGSDTGGDDVMTEGHPDDYDDRQGYQPDFLGNDFSVDMPKVTGKPGDILEFSAKNDVRETELRYHNFSVVMNKPRRICFFSAVNIEGKLSRKTKRPGWSMDPRIPREYQIIGECYGNAPKFSRGHMTRREDPAWGGPEEAHRGNADSMHVTNAVPQMQTFNAGIWLGLEDFALDNAREDDMKISVITGPVLKASDPVRYGVKIPVEFWKVIAFVHDETGKLTATGYSMSQSKFLSDDEFVFGAYETHQRSLAWIEKKAGVSFGDLTQHDQFEEEEAVAAGPLTDPKQIRWR